MDYFLCGGLTWLFFYVRNVPLQLWHVWYIPRQKQLKIAIWPLKYSNSKWRNVTESPHHWTLLVQSVSQCDWEQMLAWVSDDSPPVCRLLFTGCIVRDCICNYFVYWMSREETADSGECCFWLIEEIETQCLQHHHNTNFMLITMSCLGWRFSVFLSRWISTVYIPKNQYWLYCFPSKPRICHWASV